MSLFLMLVGLLAAQPVSAFTGSRFNQNAQKLKADVEHDIALKDCRQRHPGNTKAWAQCEKKVRLRMEEKRALREQEAADKKPGRTTDKDQTKP